MVILPIINRGKIFNVEIKLKDAKKIRKGIKYTNVLYVFKMCATSFSVPPVKQIEEDQS